MPSDVAVILTDSPSAAAIQRISDALDQFNTVATGIADRAPVAVLAVDLATDEVKGGVIGRTSLGMLFIDLFFLPDELRGSGLGSQMLHAIEGEGRRRGCRSAVLYTITFQAPAFYVRHGWTVFGEVPCDPEGTARVFLSKDLLAGHP